MSRINEVNNSNNMEGPNVNRREFLIMTAAAVGGILDLDSAEAQEALQTEFSSDAEAIEYARGKGKIVVRNANRSEVFMIDSKYEEQIVNLGFREKDDGLFTGTKLGTLASGVNIVGDEEFLLGAIKITIMHSEEERGSTDLEGPTGPDDHL